MRKKRLDDIVKAEELENDIDVLDDEADEVEENVGLWEAAFIATLIRQVRHIIKGKKVDISDETFRQYDGLLKRLAGVTIDNVKKIKNTFEMIFEYWYKKATPLFEYRGVPQLPLKSVAPLQNIIREYTRTTAEDIINITKTKALCIVDQNGNTIRLQDEIYKALKSAVEGARDGQGFYPQMRKTLVELGNSGVRVDYGGGVTRRLDTVVRQNMLYGLKNAHRDYNQYIADTLQCDGIEIDYHTNARESHRFMQGKQYSTGEAVTIRGKHYPSAQAEGIYDRLYVDYGCRHYETAIILGVSEPRYTDAQLEAFKRRDEYIYDINGVKKDGYEWSQTMRNLETNIRKQKDIMRVARAGGDKELVKECRQKIAAYMEKYEEIAGITGISIDKNRLR